MPEEIDPAISEMLKERLHLRATLRMARDALVKATHGDEYSEYMDEFNKIKEALDE